MKLVIMHDGNVVNAEAITHIIREENYSYIYFTGGTKLSYVETPAELAHILQSAIRQHKEHKNGSSSDKHQAAADANSRASQAAADEKALPEPADGEADRKALPSPDAVA